MQECSHNDGWIVIGKGPRKELEEMIKKICAGWRMRYEYRIEPGRGDDGQELFVLSVRHS